MPSPEYWPLAAATQASADCNWTGKQQETLQNPRVITASGGVVWSTSFKSFWGDTVVFSYCTITQSTARTPACLRSSDADYERTRNHLQLQRQSRASDCQVGRTCSDYNRGSTDPVGKLRQLESVNSSNVSSLSLLLLVCKLWGRVLLLIQLTLWMIHICSCEWLAIKPKFPHLFQQRSSLKKRSLLHPKPFPCCYGGNNRDTVINTHTEAHQENDPTNLFM